MSIVVIRNLYVKALYFLWIVLCSCLMALSSCSSGNDKTNCIALENLLDEMVSVEADVSFPVPTFTTKHVSSYDRRSILPGTSSWHANRDNTGFVRYESNNGRVEKVLFDEEGPGVITRMITTGGADGANLRIYFDGAKEAAILIPAYDIAKFPLAIPEGLLYRHEHYDTTQGSSFYYPLPYAKSCKITVDNVDRDYFFHASCRTYPKNTEVRSFTLEEANELQAKAQQVSNQLMYPRTYGDNPIGRKESIATGASILMELPKGGKAIRSLLFQVSEFDSIHYASLMRGLIVNISFDGKRTVRVPLSDLVGAGMGAPAVDSYYLEADGKGKVLLRFAMPYQEQARIEVNNISDYPVTLEVKACLSDWKWKNNTLYFHADWRQENGLPTNCGIDYNMGTLKGRGVFKGDMLSLYNYSSRWYGEGDEHIWVDNDTFPSHFGCGTEDYYNTTFAPIHVYFNPFGGAPREDDEASRGYNTFVRTRNLDNVPFNEHLKFEFELISWDGGKVDYASTLFWYGDLDTHMTNPSDDQAALYDFPPAIFTDTEHK